MTPYDRQLRDEYEAARLEDAAEQAAWALYRDEDLGIERRRTSTGEMEYRWATERAEVENAFPDGQGWRALGLPFEMSEDAA